MGWLLIGNGKRRGRGWERKEEERGWKGRGGKRLGKGKGIGRGRIGISE